MWSRYSLLIIKKLSKNNKVNHYGAKTNFTFIVNNNFMLCIVYCSSICIMGSSSCCLDKWKATKLVIILKNDWWLLKTYIIFYLDNIKVGGALIDSAWSTGFNNFEWDKKKFPHPEKIVQTLHNKGIRLILVNISLNFSGWLRWLIMIPIFINKPRKITIYLIMEKLLNGGMEMEDFWITLILKQFNGGINSWTKF